MEKNYNKRDPREYRGRGENNRDNRSSSDYDRKKRENNYERRENDPGRDRRVRRDDTSSRNTERPSRPYVKKDYTGGEQSRPYRRPADGDRSDRNTERPSRPYVRKDYAGGEQSRPYRRPADGDRFDRNTERPSRPYVRKDYTGGEQSRPYRRPADGDRSDRNTERPSRPYVRKDYTGGEQSRPYRKPADGDRFNRNDRRESGYDRNESYSAGKRPYTPFKKRDYTRESDIDETQKEELRQKHYSKKKQLQHRIKNVKEDTELRLNRYISMAGISSRRDADVFILEGRVRVNGEIVQVVGTKVKKSDKVEVDDVIIVPERKVYLVLNKPKDYVTTVEDPLERKTVMNLVAEACKERIYPIGRLDRQTTGVLLFTNDGDVAKKLTHPKYEHKKIYHVFLDKPLIEEDMAKISSGFELEDGFIKADEISYVTSDHSEVGVEIHSGRNRIVRRIFEHLGYQLVKLDRVYFAGITKKNLPRGRWRFLTPEEVKVLKFYRV